MHETTEAEVEGFGDVLWQDDRFGREVSDGAGDFDGFEVTTSRKVETFGGFVEELFGVV